MNTTTDYRTLRDSVGVYSPAGPLIHVTGEDRFDFLDAFLSRSAEYVDVETTRECLALSEDGTPFAIFLHLEREDETWLLPRTSVTADEVASYLSRFITGDVAIEVAPDGWGAVAFEGPSAWRVAAELVDFDIAGLVLHSITDVEVPGHAGKGTPFLARVGTTGEYGYLLVSDDVAVAREIVFSHVEEFGGAEVSQEGLARVQAEAGMPYYAMGVRSLDVNTADLSWLLDWNRLGEFHGSESLVAPVRDQRKLAPVVAEAGISIEDGETVRVGSEGVGTIFYRTPPANPEEELYFAVIDAPYGVPTLTLSASAPVRTVSLPRVVARSTVEKMG